MKLMRFESTKKLVKAAVFGIILLLASGTILGTTAQAQRWGHRWNNRGGIVVTRQRVFVTPRVRVFTYPRAYRYPRVYTYGYSPYGYYSRYNTGSPGVAEQRGYSDGFNRGREDARHGRGYDPNNSSHFRDSISAAYRDGFRRGYDNGFRQYAG